jgi:hypothetical protein
MGVFRDRRSVRPALNVSPINRAILGTRDSLELVSLESPLALPLELPLPLPPLLLLLLLLDDCCCLLLSISFNQNSN